MNGFLKGDILLKNNHLAVKIANPENDNKNSRFDRTGFMMQVTLDDQHTFCTQESLIPGEGTGGIGLCNEFGLEQAIGYEETKIHGKFPKIGVGLLVKPDDQPYYFHRPYVSERFPIVTNHKENSVTFVCLPVEHNGYAVELTKSIHLINHFVEVRYLLKNVGYKFIHTYEYNHNFINIDDGPIGPLYQLTLPCHVNPEILPDVLAIDGQQMIWTKTPDQDFYFKIAGFDSARSYSWQLIHLAKGAGVREFGDFRISHFALWGKAHVVSPEVFCEVSLQPHEKMSWTRRYEFFKC
jgi:hypothetical protein